MAKRGRWQSTNACQEYLQTSMRLLHVLYVSLVCSIHSRQSETFHYEIFSFPASCVAATQQCRCVAKCVFVSENENDLNYLHSMPPSVCIIVVCHCKNRKTEFGALYSKMNDVVACCRRSSFVCDCSTYFTFGKCWMCWQHNVQALEMAAKCCTLFRRPAHFHRPHRFCKCVLYA